MTTNRRNFVKQSALALLATSSFDRIVNQPIAPLPLNATADDSYWQLVRKQFPLSTKKIYLNNGTMGPSPYTVIDAVHKAMAEMDEQGHYGGWEATAAKIAAFAGADSTEIALTTNVTQGINIVCWGLPLKKGDEVIISTHEHAGGCLAWLNRAKLHGIVLKTFAPAATADETLSRIQKLYTSKTRAIAVPHLPCTQGQVLPVKAISKWGREKGLFVFIDGAHGPGMLPLDLKDIGCDAYASCCHKWMLGPKGTGFLYVRKDVQETVQTIFAGAGSDDASWNMSHPQPVFGNYNNNAHRYYFGTQNNALFKGVDAAIDFLQQVGKETVYKRVTELGLYTQQKLQQTFDDKLELLTPTEAKSRAAVTGFRIKGVDYKEVYTALQKEQIIIRMVPENDVNCLRVSTHIYNTTAEVDQLIEVLKRFN